MAMVRIWVADVDSTSGENDPQIACRHTCDPTESRSVVRQARLIISSLLRSNRDIDPWKEMLRLNMTSPIDSVVDPSRSSTLCYSGC